VKKFILMFFSLSLCNFALAQETNSNIDYSEWATNANNLTNCSPSSFPLPNLAEISFLQAAITAILEPAVQNKINSYFKDSKNTVIIEGWQNNKCIIKFRTQPANSAATEYECSYSKDNLSVVSDMSQQLVDDHSGLTASTYMLDAIKASKQSCK